MVIAFPVCKQNKETYIFYSETKKLPWFKLRKYQHFDNVIGSKQASEIVYDKSKIAKHSFYPLINFTISSNKVKKNKEKNGIIILSKKERPISYASHLDSHIYSYYSYLLREPYENILIRESLDSSILAFRKLGKSNINFAKQVFDEIAKRKNCYVLCLDIKGFFDNLDHNILKKKWCKIIEQTNLPDDHFTVFKAVTKYAKIDRNALYNLLGQSKNNPSKKFERLCSPKEFRDIVRKNGLIQKNNTNRGIPQGLPISAMLSNIYMIDFDLAVNSYIQSLSGCYYRYCDDIFIVVPDKAQNRIDPFIHDEIEKIQLEIQHTKTEKIHFYFDGKKIKSSKPLQYLGFIFDGERIYLRSSSLMRYFFRMRRGVKLAKATMNKINAARESRQKCKTKLYRKKLYSRYSHLGLRNFITYSYRSAAIMEAPTIKKQIKSSWARLQKHISEKNQ